MARRVSLQREWELGDRIGGGGFGKVYAAKAADSGPAVAKLVPKAKGAQRELLFVDLTNVRNVVPIIDSGETSGHWVLVMPRAEESLRDRLRRAAGALEPAAAIAILTDVVTALVDLDGKVVHRDVKPENILLLQGKWCLADFGISRYAEATTAPDTQKYALSPAYSAPERWRGERATIAVDVYSVGVIAYEMLMGALPFSSRDVDGLREEHLHGAPTPLAGVPPQLAALVEECLYKAAAARPSPANVLARLGRMLQAAPRVKLGKLQEANLAEATRLGESARRESEARSEAERRAALVDAAKRSWGGIAHALKETISQAAPTTRVEPGRGGAWSIRLGSAQLRLAEPVTTALKPWGSREAPAFDVIAHSSVSVEVPSDRYGYEGRSHSLWYCDARETGRYQWFECAFMFSPLIQRMGRQDPFALDPGEEAGKALWVGMAEFQMAWPFMPIDLGDMDDFIARWGDWFADATQRRLQRPSTMPERHAEGSWRRR